MSKFKPLIAGDYRRMWDLVRYQRSELLDVGLITIHEYGELASLETQNSPGQGSPSARRLESYDEMRQRLDALELANKQLREELARGCG